MRLLLLLTCTLASAFQLHPAARPAAAQPAVTLHGARLPAPAMVSKSDLIEKIAQRAGVPQKTASLVLTAALDQIVESVSEEQKVSLVGFGTFGAKHRPTREARNPKTGEKMMVPAALVPTFSFGKTFKDTVKAAGKERGI